MHHPDRVLGLALLIMVIVAGFLFALPPAHGSGRIQDIAGHLPKLSFSLVDDRGRNVTADNYKGEVVLLYFGFASCPDKCPVTMDRVAHLLGKMGRNADSMRVLFVSIDPAHDNPERLRKFISPFDPSHMTGLTGTTLELAALTKRYRTAWRPEGGAMHGDTVYIFDRTGEAQALLTPQDSDADALASFCRVAIK